MNRVAWCSIMSLGGGAFLGVVLGEIFTAHVVAFVGAVLLLSGLWKVQRLPDDDAYLVGEVGSDEGPLGFDQWGGVTGTGSAEILGRPAAPSPPRDMRSASISRWRELPARHIDLNAPAGAFPPKNPCPYGRGDEKPPASPAPPPIR